MRVRTCGRSAAAGLTAALVVWLGGPAATEAQVDVMGPQLAQGGQVTFAIPPQPLSSALVLFGQQSGRQVTADGALLRGVATQGVQGTMSLDVGLRQLLAGTNLTHSGLGGGTISLQRIGPTASNAVQLDPINVQGYPVPAQAMIDNIPAPYAGGQVAKGAQLGMLGNRDVMDTPFNQTSYTARKVQDQQAKTVRDVLIDDPSVRYFVPDGSAGADQLFVRGFSVANASATYGGLYGMLPPSTIMPEMAERIELLKGPSALLNGMTPESSIGGTVNVVPKRAPEDPLTQLTASYSSNTQFGGHADVARRFGADKQFGARMNVAVRGGETAVQNNTDQRALAALGLDFRGERVRLSGDFGYQQQTVGGVIPFIALGAGIPLPYAPEARKNFGQSWSTIQRKDLFGVARIEFDVTDYITAYAAAGAHDFRSIANSGGFNVFVTNFNGTGVSTPLNQSLYYTNYTGETGLRAVVDTGPINHEIAFTGTIFTRETGNAVLAGTPYMTSIYGPNVIAQNSLGTPNARKTATSTLSSVALADTLSAAGKRIQLTVGARMQRVSTFNFDGPTGLQSGPAYDESAVSPAVAVVVKPWNNVSVYGNFIQGLLQGEVAGPEFTNAGQTFAPFKATQIEAGVKIDWGVFTTTASLFQITQPSTLVDGATNSLVAGGEQRNRGLEFNVFGTPTDGVRLLGGFMLLDAVLTQTQDGLNNGWAAIMSPPFQLNLAGEWDLPFVRGLTLNSRVVHTGSQYIDTGSPRRSLPAWTRFDVGARYVFDNAQSPTGKPIAIRFNVENLFDSDYWASGSSGTLALGAPRTFRLSLTGDF